MAMIRGLIDGERRGEVLAELARGRMRSKVAASLLINSPAHVRGGLVFTTEIVITPRQQLQDA
jgi:hypothetical protein